MSEDATAPLPGYRCPFCGADGSPIARDRACEHLFVVDGENGWRFTPRSRPLFDAANAKQPTLFRDLLYHDAACRAHLRLRRADYDDALEMYVWSDDPQATVKAFADAIDAAS